MLDWLWLIPALPLLGSICIASGRGKMPKTLVTLIGTGSIGLAALCVALVSWEYLSLVDQVPFVLPLWTWVETPELSASFAFYLDGLACSMLFVITGVGFLIHIYASGYMYEDPSYPRFFTYTNLFVAAMIVLVLADNYLLLFLGWEGVGLCSFLLIGFWYQNPENGLAARKAFVITRIGDMSFAIGLFLLYQQVKTLDIQLAMNSAQSLWSDDPHMAGIIALLLLGGAVGKSAQLPLQTWLPDAMAGPTPVSALIHAATMVTAGVYLIARSHVLFELAPMAMQMVALVGACTLVISGCTALMQTDLKRVLAYSTISQIGYMFLALGVGAWSSAIFHLMTHAFFKALLFLTAGSIILAVHHKQNIFEMGGLRKALPVPFWAFLIGCLGLTALPPTAGFFSKEEIIMASWSSATGGFWIWLMAVFGAFLTGLYTFRCFFLVFFGTQKTDAHAPTGFKMNAPLIILSVLTLIGGFIHLPLTSVFLGAQGHHPPVLVEAIAVAMPILGILVAYLLFYRGVLDLEALQKQPVFSQLKRFFYSGWGMDWLYHKLFILPYTTLANWNQKDIIDKIPQGSAHISRGLHHVLTLSQNGQLRLYMATIATSAVLLIILAV